jgi:hypothetical protein
MIFDRLSSLFQSRPVVDAAVIAGTAASAVGLAYGVVRESLSSVSEDESIMNFSQLGILRCICNEEQPENLLMDRRQFCRSCGGEVVEQNDAMLSKQLSAQEILQMTRNLRKAGVRARNLQVPSTVTDIHELNAWLDSDSPKDPRIPPSRTSTTIERHLHN